MRINTSTDYAVRMVLCLAKESGTVSSSKLAAAIGVSSRYLLQVSAKLRDAGLIVTTHGPNGGAYLSRRAEEISLYDVIYAMEKQSMGKGTLEVRGIQSEFQILHAAYRHVDTVLRDLLKSITIESLLTQDIETWYLAPQLVRTTNGTSS